MPLAWSSLSARTRRSIKVRSWSSNEADSFPYYHCGGGQTELRNAQRERARNKSETSWSRKTRFARVLDSNSERESGERLRLLRDRGAKNDGMERFLPAKPGTGTGTGTNHAVAPNVSHRGTGWSACKTRQDVWRAISYARLDRLDRLDTRSNVNLASWLATEYERSR